MPTPLVKVFSRIIFSRIIWPLVGGPCKEKSEQKLLNLLGSDSMPLEEVVLLSHLIKCQYIHNQAGGVEKSYLLPYFN